MKTLIQSVIKVSVILIFVFAGFLKAQNPEYIKVIEQLDDSLFIITLMDSDSSFISQYISRTEPSNFAIVLQGSGSPENIGTDILETNMYMPDNVRGVKPYDICYNPNFHKIYIYGNQRLLIFDAFSHDLIDTINVSTVGDQMLDWTQAYPKIKCLAYDTEHDYLYCATLGRELIIIDGETDEVYGDVLNMYDKSFQIGTMVIWNQSANKVYWLNNFYHQGTLLKIIEADETPAVLGSPFLQDVYIYDLDINSFSGTCYAGTNNGLHILDADDFSNIHTTQTLPLFEITYNYLSNKVYGHEEDSYELLIFDGTSGYIFTNTISLSSNEVFNSTYNYIDNKVYFTVGGGEWNNFHIIGIDGDDNVILDEQINGARSLLYDNFDNQNKIFCGGYNVLAVIDGTTNQVNTKIGDGCLLNYLCFNQGNGELISVSHLEHTMSFFEPLSFLLEGSTEIGGATYIGCYNSSNNKVYYSHFGLNYNDSFISIFDGANNNFIDSVNGMDNIFGMCYNKLNNRVFVSSFSNNCIRVIDGMTNELISTININWPRQVFSFKNKIYCGTDYSLISIKADNYSYNEIPPTINFAGNKWTFTGDEELNRIFLVNAGIDKVFVIDYNSNQYYCEPIELPLDSKPMDIVYNKEDDKIYIVDIGPGQISILSGENYQTVTNINVPDGVIIRPIAYAILSNEIYFCAASEISPYNYEYSVYGINGISNGIKYKTQIDAYPTSMYYNERNNTIYINKHFSSDFQLDVTGIDCTEGNIIQTVKTGNYQIPGLLIFNEERDRQNIVYNTISNKLYTGNFGFANISAIKIGEDKLRLNSGYSWLSFPRMPRYAFSDEPYSTVEILNKINWFPTDLILESQNTNQYKQYDVDQYPYWFGTLDELYSTKGYKLNLSNDLPDPEITLYGARLYHDCTISLAGGGTKNWIGYFIEESQYPWQAFPSELYNGPLTMIQAQYWMMVKTTSGWIQSGKVTPIKYGDMVIVKINQQSYQFQWNDPEESEQEKEIPMPQAYNWEEKADYIPFFVEIDSTSDIAEIAVKVYGECMGATVRLPGDILVEVDGYIEGLPAGAIVEFETWNGQKSTPVEKDGYVVYNPLTGKKEKRRIYIGEKKDYYEVSLKAGEVFTIPNDVSHVTCQPNPFTNETLITMRLNGSQTVWVEIYDITGVKVKTLIEDTLPGGYYEIKWKGDNETGNKVKEGVYFYKIRTGSGTKVSDKIVLIH